MTDEELNKWNLRFCPKCRGHIQISFRRQKEGGIEIIKHCQNFDKCDYRSVLSKENISNNDRHKIIETFFGYNKSFFIDTSELKSLTNEKLLFDNIEDFLKWFVFETSRYKALDHNNLPVSSPYWTIINKLGQFLSDNYEYELKQIIQNKDNIGNEQFLKPIQDFHSTYYMPDKMENLEQFKEYIEIAEKNLSFLNDSADEVALKYYKMALEIKPTDTEVKQQYETLEKIVNHKNYKYSINDEKTIELMKIFVDCCNVKEFERLYKIISDDFVCISRYFGRTKKSFIDSVYFERKSMMGLWTEIFQYENKNRQVPCVKLNNFGVLFFNIENDKIIRAFEYKIDEKLDRKKLTKWTE